jgi:hypothetical protein
MPPPRVIVALAVALFLAVLIGWIIAVLPGYRRLGLSSSARRALTIAIVLVLTTTIAWLLVVLPAYWD